MTDKAAENKRPEPNFDYSSGAAELRGEIYRPPEYLEYLEKATVALRTVRLIVYAGMAGFIVLAFYGFILIYRLTTDVHQMVNQTELVTQQMQAMTRSMASMNQNITVMAPDIRSMSGNMSGMKTDMATMTAQMGRMSEAMTLMQHSARNMDQTISPMMGTLNNMMPFWPGNSGVLPPYAR